MIKCVLHPKQIITSICVKIGCSKQGTVVCASCISRDHPSHNQQELQTIQEFLENSDKRVFQSRNSTVAKQTGQALKIARQSIDENCRKLKSIVDEVIRKTISQLDSIQNAVGLLDKPIRNIIDQEGGLTNISHDRLQTLCRNQANAQRGQLNINSQKIAQVSRYTEKLLQNVDRLISGNLTELPQSPAKNTPQKEHQSPSKPMIIQILPASLKELLVLGKAMQQIERFGDSIEVAKKIICLNENLSKQQRNLFSVAYKNSAGELRSALRNIKKLQPKDRQVCQGYTKHLQNELSLLCNGIISILDIKVLPAAKDPQSQVYFLKMKADYYRFKAQFLVGDMKETASKKSHEAYKKGMDLAAAKLQTTNPVRLGLLLNYSVYLYQIQGNTTEACRVSKDAFDSAIKDIDDVSGQDYKDTTNLMKLIRDNLTLWNQ